jgi:hypothetical protein
MVLPLPCARTRALSTNLCTANERAARCRPDMPHAANGSDGSFVKGVPAARVRALALNTPVRTPCVPPNACVRSYCQLLKIFNLTWVFSLPFVLVHECGYFTPFVIGLIAMAFFGLDQARDTSHAHIHPTRSERRYTFKAPRAHTHRTRFEGLHTRNRPLFQSAARVCTHPAHQREPSLHWVSIYLTQPDVRAPPSHLVIH